MEPKSSSGVKHDSDKLQWGLLDLPVRQELETFEALIRVSAGVTAEIDVYTTVMELITVRSYIMAAAIVMVHKGVTLEDIVGIYTKGCEKYGPEDWKSVRPVTRYLSAAMRHSKDGINRDDFGYSHWAHFCWNMIALRWFEKNGEVIK